MYPCCKLERVAKGAVMNALTVYYSLEGNTRYAAEKISEYLGAETLELRPKKSYPNRGLQKFFWGGKDAAFKETPELEPYTADLSDKECVIVATPVWFGTFSPPIRTLIRDSTWSGKGVALVACSSSGHAERCLEGLRKAMGLTDVVPTLSLVNPKAGPIAEVESEIETFCNQIR